MPRNTAKQPNDPENVELKEDLFDVGAVDFKGYHKLKLHETNPEAPPSPIFLNLRTPDNPKPGPPTPEIVEKIAKKLYDYVMSSGIQFDYIAGIPNAADPIVKALCEFLPDGKQRLLQLTKIVEKDGKRHIGPLTEESALEAERGGVVLLCDDLITKSGSKLEAVKKLEEAGLIVHDIVVLIDREQGGKEELAEAGYQLHSILPLTYILNYGLITERISIEKYREIAEYRRNN